jgi:hypothetical protein
MISHFLWGYPFYSFSFISRELKSPGNSVIKAKEEYEAAVLADELERKKQALASWEEVSMKEEERERQIKQTNSDWQKKLEDDFFGKVERDTRIRLCTDKSNSAAF